MGNVPSVPDFPMGGVERTRVAPAASRRHLRQAQGQALAKNARMGTLCGTGAMQRWDTAEKVEAIWK